METIVIMSNRGGNGKSTIARNLAALAAEDGKNVYLFDTTQSKSTYDFFARRIPFSSPQITPHFLCPCKSVLIPFRYDANELADSLDEILFSIEHENPEVDLIIIDTDNEAVCSDHYKPTIVKHADLTLFPVFPCVNHHQNGIYSHYLDTTFSPILRDKPFKYAVILNGIPLGNSDPYFDSIKKTISAQYSTLAPVIHFRQEVMIAEHEFKFIHEFAPQSEATQEFKALYAAIDGILSGSIPWEIIEFMEPPF